MDINNIIDQAIAILCNCAASFGPPEIKKALAGRVASGQVTQEQVDDFAAAVAIVATSGAPIAEALVNV